MKLPVITRREALLLPFALSAEARAWNKREKFPGVTYREYDRRLPDYISALAAEAHERRLASLADLTSAEAVRTRQTWARSTLLRLIGSFPDKTPLRARVTGSHERQNYLLERVIYESRPGFPISGNVYIPTHRSGPYPGVLFQLGHAANGKAWGSYQSACQGLVQLGFLVLAFDPIGQGERIYYPDDTGRRTRLDSSDEEHSRPGRQMLLINETCTQYQLWDAVRSLDLLEGHPLVDPSRLASTGQSGGGTLTMLLAAVDDRLKAAAVFSGNTENVACRDFKSPGSTDDAEQNFIAAGPAGFDRWDLLYPFAPKPLLISISDKDFFGTYSPNYVSDSWEEYQRLADAYKLLGAGTNLSWSDTPLPHGLSYDSRLTLYNWALRHLQAGAPPVDKEPPITLEAEAQLWASPTGNLKRDLKSATPFTMLNGRLSEISKNRTPVDLTELLRLDPPVEAKLTVLRTVPSARDVSVQAIDIAGIPAWLFQPPAGLKNKSVILVLNPRGRNAEWAEGQLCQQLAAQGFMVCAADMRGIGDLSPAYSSGAPQYVGEHQNEENYAWSSLILGRPLAGQRTADILTVLRGLRAETTLGIGIAALGKTTVPALFAAALEPSIRQVYTAGGLISFSNLIASEDYRYPLANFVPGILLQTDLPAIVEGLAPARIAIAGPVDASGQAADVSTANRTYSRALSQGHVAISARAEWSANGLARFFSP